MPRRNWTRRPISRPISRSSQDEAAAVLAVVEGGIRASLGPDDSPSPLLEALADLDGVNQDGLELAQDSGLLAADILGIIGENLDNPAKLASELTFLLLAAVPEIKDDIEAIQD